MFVTARLCVTTWKESISNILTLLVLFQTVTALGLYCNILTEYLNCCDKVITKDRATGFAGTLSVPLAELGASGINICTKKLERSISSTSFG